MIKRFLTTMFGVALFATTLSSCDKDLFGFGGDEESSELKKIKKITEVESSGNRTHSFFWNGDKIVKIVSEDESDDKNNFTYLFFYNGTKIDHCNRTQGTKTMTFKYSYDGEMIKEITGYYENEYVTKSIFSYDLKGRIIKVASTDGYDIKSYRYIWDGDNVATVEYYNGDEKVRSFSYQYDSGKNPLNNYMSSFGIDFGILKGDCFSKNNVKKQTQIENNGDTEVLNIEYLYDGDGYPVHRNLTYSYGYQRSIRYEYE